MEALLLATQVLSALPSLITAGINVVTLIDKTNETLRQAQVEGRDPLPAEWDVINGIIANLRSELHDIKEPGSTHLPQSVTVGDLAKAAGAVDSPPHVSTGGAS